MVNDDHDWTRDLRAAETWVFDLDNTLYPASCNLFAQIDLRMRDFIADRLDLPPDAARRLQKTYFREYGTTLRGLMSVHDLDPSPYLEYVHDIDVTPVRPDPALDTALARLPGRKVIFTNASVAHASRVMDRLGVTHHFDEIVDIVAADYVPKPHALPYERLIAQTGLAPRRAVMVEDIARNLEPAAAWGMTTVWVRTDTHWGREDADAPYVHHQTDDLVGWLDRVAG